MEIDIAKLQKEIFKNKVEKGFNTEDLSMEFCRAYEELAEAYKKIYEKSDGVGEELADVVIFVLGIAEILDINLGEELRAKVDKNKSRQYQPDENGALRRIRTTEDP